MAQQDTGSGASTAGLMARGSAWMIGWRWGARAIGLLSTLILARLLTPEDFGIVAMAMAVMGFLEVVSDACHEFALMRLRQRGREFFDAAWTIQFAAGCLLAAAIVVAAPLPGALFDEPRASAVMYVLAVRGFLTGLVNVGIIEFRMNLDFRKDFLFGICEKSFGFGLTIAFALIFRNYWALVLGMVTSKLGTVVLSYAMHPLRPHLSFARVREIWSFSSWIFLGEVTRFVTARTDEFLVGWVAGAAEMGRYTVASDVATAPTMEVVSPSMRALYPIYASIDGSESRRAILNALSAVAIIGASTAIGIALVAADFVAVALGPQWTAAAAFVQILALSAFPMACLDFAITALNARFSPRVSLLLIVIRLAMLIVGVLLGWHWAGVTGVALGRTAAGFAFLAVLLPVFAWAFALSLGDIVERLWRPAIAGGVMAATVCWSHPLLVEVPVVRLLLDSAIGAAVYGGTLLALWRVAGCPRGVETMVTEFAVARVGRLFRARQP